MYLLAGTRHVFGQPGEQQILLAGAYLVQVFVTGWQGHSSYFSAVAYIYMYAAFP